MDISENQLVRRIARFQRPSEKVVRKIGDDCAVVDFEGGRYVFTQDALVEHVHFELSFTGPCDLGKKAVYVNVSDILSMGATPLYFLVTLCIPPSFSSRHTMELYRGMSRAAREFNVVLLGGDTTASVSDLVIDVSMVGSLPGDRYLGRDKARAGDLIAVTGPLGESAFGLHLLRGGGQSKGNGRFIRRYRAPRPPFAVWRELMKRDITNAMMDISDGLLIDLERMMGESGKGAEIYLENVPVPRALQRAGLIDLALSGGEDYQLLFTVPVRHRSQIQGMKDRGFPVFVVGKVVAGKGVSLYRHGTPVAPLAKGYQHFGDQA